VYSLGEDLSGARFPLFVRWADDHEGPRTELLYDADAVCAAMEDLAAQAPERADKVFAAEYCAAPGDGGDFIVFGGFHARGTVFAAQWAATADWKQKQSIPNYPMNDWVKATRDYVYGFPHARELHRAFKLAGVDYGRADYSVVRDRVQIYEINTNPRTSRLMIKDLADVTATFTGKLDAAFLGLLHDWRQQVGATGGYLHPNFEAEHRRNAILVLMWNLERLARSSYRAPGKLCLQAASLLRRFEARVFLGPRDRAVIVGKFVKWSVRAIVRRAFFCNYVRPATTRKGVL
jgi:hypothetical protein